MDWLMFGAFIAGLFVSALIELFCELKKIKRFFALSCEVEEPYLQDVKAHYDYAVMVAPGYDYFLWSFCPYRGQFETPGECKIWNCPGCQKGSLLQCKGLKSSSKYYIKDSCVELPNSSFYEFCSDVEEKQNEPDF